MAEFSETITALCRNQIDLSTRQLALLEHCAAHNDGERQVKNIATILAISKPAVTRAADRTEELALTKRIHPPQDRRTCVIALTPKGTAFLKAIHDGGAKAKLA